MIELYWSEIFARKISLIQKLNIKNHYDVQNLLQNLKSWCTEHFLPQRKFSYLTTILPLS